MPRLIRTLEAADSELFRRLRLLALQESPEAFGTDYSEAVNQPLTWFTHRIRADADRFVLGAFVAEALIGVAAFAREDGIKSRHKGTITSMYVHRSARRDGTGMALLLEIKRRALAMPGIERINLAVVANNVAAAALYTRCGFRAYGIEPVALRVQGATFDEVLMQLSLPGND